MATPIPCLHLGDLQVQHLPASRFRLDGGTMFGVVPRPLWEQVSPPDARNRVELACNCLLVRQAGGLTLVDTGCGQEWAPREQEIFAFDPVHTLVAALSRAGVQPEQITRVVLTHLHFDHAGGTVHRREGQLQPLFTNATYLVQRGEWEEALAGVSIMKSSYRPDALQPLGRSGQLRLLDGDTDLDGELSVFVTGGHTAHHQGVCIRAGGRTLLYPGELVPTQAHLRLHWNMAYDMFPYQTLTRKKAFLAEAVTRQWILAWDHDPHLPWSRIIGDGDRLRAEAL
ncbi:MAG: MBL fold metallo-hydrolase [Candidatus Latescibacteria bacterium]|nr:MBL fold metallo-hydrolase [Candidatus Latescibacterota bacterium]